MEFCYVIRNMELGIDEVCEVDFSHVKNCDPYPMLIVASAIREFRKQYRNNPFKAVSCTNSYANHMKFYRACGINLGEDIEISLGKSGYEAITKMSVQNLKSECLETRNSIQELIDSKSKEMAKVVAQGNKGFENWIAFAIREIIRNIPEHSKGDEIWYCAQYWPSFDLVELAIMDEGIGIKESLIRGGKISSDCSDEEAIRLALEPGISGESEYIHDVDWKNSGFGLYMVSQMCAELDASFIISSGNAAVTVLKHTDVSYVKTNSNVKGTAIQIRIRPTNTVDYESIRRKILFEGEKRAKQNSKAIHSASKASRTFG